LTFSAGQWHIGENPSRESIPSLAATAVIRFARLAAPKNRAMAKHGDLLRNLPFQNANAALS